MPESFHKESPAISPANRIILLAARIAVVALAIISVIRLFHRQGPDFRNHCTFALRFIHHQFIYAGGLNNPYPPFWAMAHVPFALLPLPCAQVAFFGFGFAAFLGLLILLNYSLCARFPLNLQQRVTVAALTVFVLLRFIWRDFDEGGPNLLLLGLSWFSIALWMRNPRHWLAGIPLGLAIALKCTAVIFPFYFLWKRQWRLAFSSLLAAAFFTLLPWLYLGTSSYAAHMRFWAQSTLTGVTQSNPSIGVLGPESISNKSLRPVLARYLMHVGTSPGESLPPGYLNVLNLPPRAAGIIIKAILLAGVLFFLWFFRHPIAEPDSLPVLWELSALCILMLLYSPITWGQHCVAAIPALYFVLAEFYAAPRKIPAAVGITLAVFIILITVPNRAILQESISQFLETFHLVTLALLLLLAMAVFFHRRSLNTPTPELLHARN